MIADVLTFKGFRGWTIGETLDTLTWDAVAAGRPAPDQAEIDVWETEWLAAKSAKAAQDAADATAQEEARADAVVQYLRDHTPAECEAYVQANVTDISSARALMKKFAVVLCVLAKQRLR